MQLIFEKETNKYLKTMRWFNTNLMVLGNFKPFERKLRSLGAKFDKYRSGFIISEKIKESVEVLSKTINEYVIDKTTKKPKKIKKEIKLLDDCTIEYKTDPTYEETYKRVGRNYPVFFIVQMDNDIFQSMETEIRAAKDIQLGTLPEQLANNLYSYYDGLFTIIPPDPLTEEELNKIKEKKDAIINIKELKTQIKETDLTAITGAAAAKLLLDLKKNELLAA